MDKRSKIHLANRFSGGDRKINKLRPANRVSYAAPGKRGIPRGEFAEVLLHSLRESDANFPGQISSNNDNYLRWGGFISNTRRNPEDVRKYTRKVSKTSMEEQSEAQRRKEDSEALFKGSEIVDADFEAKCKVTEEVSGEE